MTTKFLDNKIFTFKILLSWRFPGKIAFWTIFLSAPLPTPPLKNANFIFIVVSLSLRNSDHCPRLTAKMVMGVVPGLVTNHSELCSDNEIPLYKGFEALAFSAGFPIRGSPPRNWALSQPAWNLTR